MIRQAVNRTSTVLVPLQIAKKAMAAAREAWLATNPKTSGTNDLDVISFYDRSDWLPRAVNFGVTWAEYRVADTNGPPETTPAQGTEISAHYVNEPRYRAMVDGELISASTAEKFVGVMRINTRFSAPDPDNDTFMKGVAERSAVFGHKMRTDSVQNFIADMHATGMIQLVNREIRAD